MFQADTRNMLASLAAAALVFSQLLLLGAVDGPAAAFFALGELAVSVLLILLLDSARADPAWRALAPVMLLFFAALAWAALPLVLPGWIAAPLARDAIPLELLKLAGLGAIWLGGALIGLSSARLQRFVLTFAVVGLAYTLLALWAGQASPFTVWGQPKGAHAFRFTGTLLNANAAGCVFGMIGMIALGLIQSLIKRIDLREARLLDLLRLAAAVCTMIAALGACVLTQSRTALTLATAFGGLLLALEARRNARKRGPSLADRIVLAVVGAVLVASLGLGASQVTSRWGTFLVDAQLRGDAYAHYFAAIARAPLFGYGLGGFRMLHQSILTPALAAGMWDFGAAHSALTQAALEGGLPFVILLSGALGLAAADAARLGKADRGAMASGVLAAVGLAVAFSFVDIALNTPAIAALCLMLFGVAWGDAVARRAGGRPRLGARMAVANVETGPADV